MWENRYRPPTWKFSAQRYINKQNSGHFWVKLWTEDISERLGIRSRRRIKGSLRKKKRALATTINERRNGRAHLKPRGENAVEGWLLLWPLLLLLPNIIDQINGEVSLSFQSPLSLPPPLSLCCYFFFPRPTFFSSAREKKGRRRKNIFLNDSYLFR